MKTTDDLGCETALREISVTGRSMGVDTSTAGESDDRPGVARLRSSVASIATLTPDRLAGGFGVRIARKRSPIELSFFSPAVAPPDGESVDDPELSIVSPSPFARPDHHEDAFTYLTQSGRSDHGSQSDDAVGPLSDSATRSPAERVFRSDRRSQLHGLRTSARSQATSHEHDGPERRDGIRSSKRTHRRGDVEAGVAARSNADTSPTSGAKSGPMPDRSRPVDDDRPRQPTGGTERRQPTRPRAIETRVTWADAIARRTLPSSADSERRRSVTDFDPNVPRSHPSSHSESLERETPSDVTTAARREPARGESASPPALIDRPVPPTGPTAPPSPSRETAQRPVRHPRPDGRRPMSAVDSSPVPTAEGQSTRRVPAGRVGPESDGSYPAADPASTTASATQSANQPLQQPSIRTDRRDRETQTATNGRDRGRSTTPSRRQSDVGTIHDGWTPIRAASMSPPVRSGGAIEPTVGSTVSRSSAAPDSTGRLEWRTDGTTRSAVSAEGRKRHPSQARTDHGVGFDSTREQSQSIEFRTADPASASADRQPSGSDSGRAAAVQSRRPRRNRPTVMTTGTDRIPRQSRAISTDSRGLHDGTAAVESSRSAFVSRESRASPRTDRTGHEPVARRTAPSTATPTMAAPSRAGQYQYPPLELATEARGAHTADGRPVPAATDRRLTVSPGSVVGRQSAESQRRFDPNATSVSGTPSPPPGTDTTRVVDDYRSGSSTAATTTGRAGPTESPIRAFSSVSGRPSGDRRPDRTPSFERSTTDIRSFGSTATGFSRGASSPRTDDRDDGRTGSGRTSATERRSSSRPPAMQSDRRGSELVVSRHSTAAVNSRTVPDEMGAPEPNRRARVSSPPRSDAGPSNLRLSSATDAAGRVQRRPDSVGSIARYAADAVRPERSRPSDTTPTPSSATAARTGSDGSAREGAVSAWAATRPSDPTGDSAAVSPSRRDDPASIRAPTRIDSLRSVAATGPSRGEIGADIAPLLEREPTEPRGAASLNSRGPQLAVTGGERSHRSQQGTEAAVRSESSSGPVRSSRREPVAADAPDVISQRRGSGMEPVTQRGGSEAGRLTQMGGSRTGSVSRTRSHDGERGTRSLEHPRSSAASGATTATPVTISNSDTPSAPSHTISRSRQPSAADTEPAAASSDPKTALGTAVTSSSRRFESGTTRDRAGTTPPDSSGRMPVLRLRSDRGPSPGRSDRTIRPPDSRPDSSRSESALRSGRSNPNAGTEIAVSQPVTGTPSFVSSHVSSATQNTWSGSGDGSQSRTAGPTGPSRTRREGERATSDSSFPDTGPVGARVRETSTRTTTHTHSTNAVASPSRTASNPRRPTRSNPLTSDDGSQFGAEFGRRSATLQYRSPAVTDPTGSRSQSPRDGRSAVTVFDHGNAAGSSPTGAMAQHRPSGTDAQRTVPDRSSSERKDSIDSRPRSEDWRGREPATGPTGVDPQEAVDSATLRRPSRDMGVDTTASAARSRPRPARGSLVPDTSPRIESATTAAAGATGVAATRAPQSDRRTPLSVLRTTAAGSSGQSHTTHRSVRPGTAAASMSDESGSRSDSRPARPPTIAVRPGSTERADASSRRDRDPIGAGDSSRERVGTAATEPGDADGLAPTASDRPSTTAGIAGERRRFESRLRMRRRPSTGSSATGEGHSGRTGADTPSLSLRTRDDVSEPTTDGAATSASSGQSRVPNAPKNKPTTNTIESNEGRTGVNGMQTSAASDRPSLTYRRSSATDAPSVDRGGPNGSNATPRDSTTPSGAARESTASRTTPGHASGRERRGSSDRRETGGDRTRSGFGSKRGRESAQSGSAVGHDDVGSRLNDGQRSSIDRPQQSAARRSEPPRGRRSDQDRHSRNRFDSVDLSSGTDPRFDADVDRAVQELYRKLERKIRVERERRGL